MLRFHFYSPRHRVAGAASTSSHPAFVEGASELVGGWGGCHWLGRWGGRGRRGRQQHGGGGGASSVASGVHCEELVGAGRRGSVSNAHSRSCFQPTLASPPLLHIPADKERGREQGSGGRRRR
ncbi:hypothetical protein DAI22_01g402950 [Oryza sativa Japonica Group]|nr:hypothetical protein DAI22_01g402950 [Oryza sativa Japonica Group]